MPPQGEGFCLALNCGGIVYSFLSDGSRSGGTAQDLSTPSPWAAIPTEANTLNNTTEPTKARPQGSGSDVQARNP